MSTAVTPSAPSHAYIIHIFQEAYSIRYVTASVYIVLLLEHLASMPDEVELVWKSSWNLAKVFFLLYRYSVIGGLTVLMHGIAGLTGPSSDTLFVIIPQLLLMSIDLRISRHSCKHTVAALAALAVFSMGIADAMVMLRVSVLWGRQRVIMATLLLSFIISYAIAVVCASITAQKLVSNASVVPVLNMCVTSARPKIVLGVWIPGTIFDIIILSLTSWNACARPRNEKTVLTQAMYRDGIAFFLILAALRMVNLFMAIWTPLFLVGLCIAWPVSCMTLSRLVFHLRRLEDGQPQPTNDSLCTLHEVQHLEYSERHDSEPGSSFPDMPQGSLLHMRRWESTDGESQGSTAAYNDAYISSPK